MPRGRAEDAFPRGQRKDSEENPAGGFGLRRERMMESLILAQNERWRRVLSMQVGRQGARLRVSESGGLVSNTWATRPPDGNSLQKCRAIPDANMRAGAACGKPLRGRRGSGPRPIS